MMLLAMLFLLLAANGCGGDGGSSESGRDIASIPTSTSTEVRATPTREEIPTVPELPSPTNPVGPNPTSTPMSAPTPTTALADGACFVGAPECTGSSIPTTRDACCELSRSTAGPLPVFWCAEGDFDPLTGECSTCSDPCEGRPRATPTPTPMVEATSTPAGCDVGHPCLLGQFCELPAGVCASDLDEGTCVGVPFVCFDAVQPVCGCDGLTYGNDCLRRGARVQKASDGACPAEECRDDCDCYATRTFATSCPLECATCDSYWTCEENRCLEHCGPIPPDRCEALCFDNEPCGPQAYCAKPVGHCDGPGACRPRPEVCLEVVDPVCGCDGQTYSNECKAGNAGVALAHHGRCEEEPTPTPTPPPSPSPEPCDVTDPCPARQFCELPAGVCASDLDGGACVAVPDSCFDSGEPVCGCDGLTYGNDCLRRAARVQKSADGSCPTAECRGDCDCYATRAFASPCPLLCPNCGNYWTCQEERCIEHCGMIPFEICSALCTDNEQCPPGEFCQKPIGQCDGLGACRARPEQCPDVVDPVCGCDRRTYSNECDAGNLGITIAHRGPCAGDRELGAGG